MNDFSATARTYAGALRAGTIFDAAMTAFETLPVKSLTAEHASQVRTEALARNAKEQDSYSAAYTAVNDERAVAKSSPILNVSSVSELPETLRAARRWDETRDRYAAAGLCDRCAAQAAYGHADGFSEIHPPCDNCAELVTALPVARVNGWRSFSRGDGLRSSWSSAALSGEISPAVD